MTYSYRPAVREGVGLFIAIAGTSRTGKTMSALKLARGIAGPNGKIATIDTEGRRMSHYAKAPDGSEDNDPTKFKFDVFNMPSPFSPERFVEAARGAQEAGFAVLVIDSFSLEWSGVGGVIETQRKLVSQGKKSDLAWALAKDPHKAMMNDLIQITIPIIFCLRANEVAAHLAGGKEGCWKVDQDKRFLYEWTVALTLHPDTPGKPRYDLCDAKGKELWKVQDQHRGLFQPGKFISEEAGAALQAWRNSEAAAAMGSSAVEPPRPKALSPKEWIIELRRQLDECDTEAEVDEIAGRWDVKEAIVNTVVAKLADATNAAIKGALDRVSASGATAPWVHEAAA